MYSSLCIALLGRFIFISPRNALRQFRQDPIQEAAFDGQTANGQCLQLVLSSSLVKKVPLLLR
jgi:hypothetical protein